MKKPAVPKKVSNYQLKMAITSLVDFQALQELMFSSKTSVASQIAWMHLPYFMRDSEVIKEFQQRGNLTDAQIDEFFIAAKRHKEY